MAYDVVKHADFLKGWCNGKSIANNGGNFWKCGKFQTIIKPEQIELLVAGNHASIANKILTMK